MKSSIYILLLTVVLTSCIHKNQLDQEKLPWLKQVVFKDRLDKIKTIDTSFFVEVSDSSNYQVKISYTDSNNAFFLREYPEMKVNMAIENGSPVISTNNQTKMGNPFTKFLTLGHQIYAHILFLDEITDQLNLERIESSFNGAKAYFCKGILLDQRIEFYFDSNYKPLGLKFNSGTDYEIEFQYSDWKENKGVFLPETIIINDQKRLFKYHLLELNI